MPRIYSKSIPTYVYCPDLDCNPKRGYDPDRTDITKYDKRNGIQRYRCKRCGRIFMDTVTAIGPRVREPNQRKVKEVLIDIALADPYLIDLADKYEVKADTVRNWLRQAAEDSRYVNIVIREQMFTKEQTNRLLARLEKYRKKGTEK